MVGFAATRADEVDEVLVVAVVVVVAPTKDASTSAAFKFNVVAVRAFVQTLFFAVSVLAAFVARACL